MYFYLTYGKILHSQGLQFSSYSQDILTDFLAPIAFHATHDKCVSFCVKSFMLLLP